MITYRKATLTDIDAINALVNSAYIAQADLIDGQRTSPSALRTMIDQENSHLELAIQDNEIIGCVYLERNNDVLYIGMLTVKPSLQGNGLGKTLMNRALDLGREWKMKSTSMNVIRETPEFISYYEKMGFKWSGKTEPFSGDDPRNGKPLKKLTFLEYVMKLSE